MAKAQTATAAKRVPRRAAPLPETNDDVSASNAPEGLFGEETQPAVRSSNVLDDVARLETRRPEGVPQVEAEPEPLEQQFEGDEELLTRRSNKGDGDARLEIPAEYKRSGWDYEWKTEKINGATVDDSEVAETFEHGWRPVLAKSMPKMMTPGFTSKYIRRLGQILYTRPQHLTDEANQEEYARAEQQKYDRLKHASDIQMPKSSMRSKKAEISLDAEFGSHKGYAKAAQ